MNSFRYINVVLICGLTSCGWGRTEPPLAADLPAPVPAAGAPETSRDAAPTASLVVVSVLDWESGLCAKRLPSGVLAALGQKVFDPDPSVDGSLKDCQYAHSFNSEVAAQATRLAQAQESLDRGLSRFLRAIALMPDLLLEKDADGRGILHYVARRDDLRLLGVLTSLGSLQKLNWPDRWGRRPLHYSKSAKMVEALWYPSTFDEVKDYLSVPPSVSYQVDAKGLTPLAVMADSGAGEAVSVAVDHLCREADHLLTWVVMSIPRIVEDKYFGNVVNLPDVAGRTPLMLAVQSGDISAVNALSSCTSTDFSKANNKGQTALHYAAIRPDFAAGSQVLMQGVHGVSEYYKVNSVSHIDVNAQDFAGDTALHLAYRCRNQQAVEMLIAFGAKSEILNSKGAMANDPDSVGLGCPPAEPHEGQ